jgi:TatD DNase family protein
LSASAIEAERIWREAAPPERGYAGLTDTHCHLEATPFDRDRPQVLQRARAAGVVRMLVPGTDLASSLQAADLAEREPDVRAAVGVHPHEAATWDARSERSLRELAARPGVVAIGEIGLDYHHMHSPREAQRVAFAAQLELAGELGLPVVVHVREALEEVLQALSSWCEAVSADSRRGVLHAFAGAASAGQWAVAHHWYVGLGGALTYPASENLREQARREPLFSSVLLETDAPYLAPQGRRGKRNEPALVALVAERLAQESGVPIERVITRARRNAQQLFGWEPE